jgi:ribA/ribD-fused uncharacterized protein
MKYDKDVVVNLLIRQKIEFLFFWGHRPSDDGKVSKRCLSQWWKSSFTHDGVTYTSAEQWMMAQKAQLFGDSSTRHKILKTTETAQVKELGRKVIGFDQEQWDASKYSIVRKGNALKFSQHEGLKTFLLATGDKVIVEASPADKIWGIGLTESNPDASDPSKWLGQNLLGFALMEVRDLIRHDLVHTL